ncbi:MAG: class III signal peptide-containing protein [bacterium]|nr:class III signal peptide-containing protein [bacterium]
MSKKNNKKKGQSTVEYILVVTAVIATLIVFLNPSGGLFSKKVNGILTDTADTMNVMSNRLKKAFIGE